jgi:protein-arginine kinase activator protein McsA
MLCGKCQKQEANVQLTIIKDNIVETRELCVACYEAEACRSVPSAMKMRR